MFVFYYTSINYTVIWVKRMPKIKEDSAFAEAILPVVVKSVLARKALAIAANKLREHVIAPILVKLKSGGVLNAEENEVMNFLATEHSSDGMQWGGVVPQLSKQDILGSPDNKLLLVSRIDERLNPAYISHIADQEALAGTMKAITDCSFCYVEKLKSKHTKDFTLIKNGIFPTPEELAIRVMRTEVGEPPQIAISYGIGTTPGVDIAPKGTVLPPGATRAHGAGKAVFLGADTFERMNVTARDYDNTIQTLADIRKKISENEGRDNTVLEKERETHLADLKKLSAQMIFYKIPLLPEYRELREQSLHQITRVYDKALKSLDSINRKILDNSGGENHVLYANRETCIENLKQASANMAFYKIPFEPEQRDIELRSHGVRKPGIQKLAEWGGDQNDALPLVATASGTTARTLIALHDLGAFTSVEGGFVSEIAQYVSSALCGTIVHGGHHSVLEVAEMYNRLLDHNAIAKLDKMPVPGVVKPGVVEESMPYYRIGDSSSLLPEAIRDPVMALQDKIMKAQAVKSTVDFKERLAHVKPIPEIPSVSVKNDGRSLHN